jgi:spore coat polysaccharide biosynthesis predicted glycosyltransferase SpsG
MPGILFRADAHPGIGTGDLASLIHLSRYFLRKGWCIFFVVRRTISACGLLKAKGLEKDIFFIDEKESLAGEIEQINRTVTSHDISAMFFEITDRKLTEYQGLPRNIFKACVSFDSNVPRDFNFVLDWGVTADSNYDQSSFPQAVFMLGPEYVILPEEFDSPAIENRTYRPEVRNVLIAMGGGDEYNVTNNVVTSLRECSSLNLFIVLGAGYAYYDDFVTTLENIEPQYTVFRNINTMFDLYMECDVGIGAGGLISSEFVATRTPTILISTYEHQISRCRYFAKRGSTLYIGHREFDPSQLVQHVFEPLIPRQPPAFSTESIVTKFCEAHRSYYAI